MLSLKWLGVQCATSARLSLARHPPLRAATTPPPTSRAQLLPPSPAGSRTTYAQRARLQIFAVASVAAAAKRTFIFSLLFIGVRVFVCMCVCIGNIILSSNDDDKRDNIAFVVSPKTVTARQKKKKKGSHFHSGVFIDSRTLGSEQWMHSNRRKMLTRHTFFTKCLQYLAFFEIL